MTERGSPEHLSDLGVVLATRLCDLLCDARKSILGLYKTYYGMFMGEMKGREREESRYFQEEQV